MLLQKKKMLQSFIHFIFFLPLSVSALGFATSQGEDCPLSSSTLNGTCMETVQCDYIGKNLQGNANLELCGSSSAKNRLTCCPNLPSKEGDNCYIWGYVGHIDYPRYPNIVGKCIPLEECETAKSLLKLKKRPNTCLLDDKMVCCPLQKFPPIKNKADEKCAEYYNVTVGARSGTFVYGGILAGPFELPHMAAIGYNENKTTTTWFCGGSLINEHFIVTAAHCTTFRGHAPNIVRLGDSALDGPTLGKPTDIGISQIYRHSDYKFSSHYHDIALLKLKSDASIRFFKPICLNTDNEIPVALEAAGWGATENSSRSNHLLKVSLNATDYNVCAPKFSSVSKRKLKNGIINELQICAGGFGHDTCTGDSGGPLHYKVPGNVLEGHTHFILAGVVSFGKGCGELGIYTRVSAYVSWIESIVWPPKVLEKITENKQNLTLINSTDQIIYQHQPPDDSRSGAFFQFEGDSCILKKADNNLTKNGTCTKIHNCDDAKKMLQISVKPQLCGFDRKEPIVCCPNEKKEK